MVVDVVEVDVRHVDPLGVRVRVASALAAELTWRAARHAEGTRPVITDAELTASTGTWIRVQELARELGTVFHDDSARRPGDDDVTVSATVALFRTATLGPAA